jgi:uncharacterized protein
MDAIADGLVRMTDQGPHLVASRCRNCETVNFPSRQSCARCSAESTVEELLAGRGTLWTWTVQSFRPKPPYPQDGEFTPFGVGYVELAGQLRIEARLTESDPARLRIGMPMELCFVEIAGSVAFAFGPEA